MRGLNRSVLLCLVIMIVTPAPAHAWFEWLDRLSGPGRWLGAKIDVRAFCFGERKPVQQLKARIDEATKNIYSLNVRDTIAVETSRKEWESIVKELERVANELGIAGSMHARADVTWFFAPDRISKLERVSDDDVTKLAGSALDDLDIIRNALVAMTAGGIFVSLCPEDQQRSFAIEFGSSWLWTGANEQFADDHSIALKTFTVGLSYRLPLPPCGDVVDLGTNVGVASFSSKGFNAFDTLVVEPFFDLHMPTKSRVSSSKAARALSRLTLRTSWVFFPKGFEAGDFGPLAGHISGSEANLSFTVYYNVRFPRASAPLARPGA